MSSNHELDGIRPSNATCTHCGIHMDGVEIKDAKVTCPGCSRAVVFELVSPPKPVDRANVATLFGWKSLPANLYLLAFIGVNGLLVHNGLHWLWALLVTGAAFYILLLIGLSLWKVLRKGA